MKKCWVTLVVMVALVSGCTETIQIVASSVVTQIVDNGITAWMTNLPGGAG